MAGSDPKATLAARAELAATAPRHRLEPFFKETAKEVLVAFARNPNLQERDLLRLLQRKDLAGEVIRQVAEHGEVAGNYTVMLAIARHPRTPRLVSLPILKFLYLFDLLRLAQTPAVPADVKLVAEQAILKKVETIPRGERITLARRGTGRIAAALLTTDDLELVHAALDNPFLTEGDLFRALARSDLSRVAVDAIAQHSKWARRYYVRLALVRHPATPFPRILEFLPDLAVNDLREACLDRRMPETVRKYVAAHCFERVNKRPRESNSVPE